MPELDIFDGFYASIFTRIQFALGTGLSRSGLKVPEIRLLVWAYVSAWRNVIRTT